MGAGKGQVGTRRRNGGRSPGAMADERITTMQENWKTALVAMLSYDWSKLQTGLHLFGLPVDVVGADPRRIGKHIIGDTIWRAIRRRVAPDRRKCAY